MFDSSINPLEPSVNGLVTLDEIFYSNEDINRKSKAYDGAVPLLPDEVAFRPDSICSDHPSLATTSIIGMDLESTGSQFADSEIGLDSAIASRATERESFDEGNVGDRPPDGPFFAMSRKFSGRNRPLPVILDVSSPSMTDQAMAESVSSIQTDAGIKDSNSMLMTDSISFDEPSMNDSTNQQNKEQSENLNDSSLLPNQRPGDLSLGEFISNDTQPHYPLAFSPENISPAEVSSNCV